MHVTTHRLLIRDVAADDADATAALWADPDVTLHMGGPRDADRIRQLVIEDAGRDPQPPYDMRSVLLRETNKLIGNCGILDKDVDGRTEHELVYVFARHAWNHGYATEAAIALRDYAFETFGLTRLIALIHRGHGASEHVAKKAGFTLERTITRPDGREMLVYSVARGSSS